MATERQIEANRQNALSSTGPRSDAGKARSATNAIMHGFTARRALLPGEDAEMLDTLNRLMVDKFGPHGPYEADLVATAASLIWRLRRVPVLEVALFHWTGRFASFPLPYNKSESSERPEEISSDTGWLVENLLTKDLLSKLTRYEVSLTNQLRRTMDELQKIAKKRADEQASDRKVVTFTADQAANTDAPYSVERLPRLPLAD